MSDIKTIDSLMRYLRNTHNIQIQGSTQKKKLKNIGYYHGFKGYRFIKNPNNSINYTDFNEIVALNKFDMDLKSLLYPKIMFLETALKNHVLNIILEESNSSSFFLIYEKILTEYSSYSVGSKEYSKSLKKRLKVRDQIYNTLTRDYSNNKAIVQHFYHKDIQVPIWAIFEIITLGDFGNFVSCMNINIKKKVSIDLKLHQPCDTNGILTEKIIYLLKDLRNSVAHNNVIFDCRFKTNSVNNALKKGLEIDTSIPNVTFDTIVDYIILIVYLLKNINTTKTELNKFVSDFENILNNFKPSVPANVYSRIIYTNTRPKLNLLKNYIKS